ncbi:MAG: dipeptide ABC transporter ATP-binding protein [Deltaproteobacteria bacterium]|nr:dipeptide ABC transporter ATP-binding protein [Deltaproteobacteria bacterium]
MDLLEINDLEMHFPIRRGLFSKTRGVVKAVDGVSFTLKEGETLGLVGESGCGKTTVARSLLRLIEPTGGSVKFEGVDILRLSKKELRQVRARLQVIFQDPYSSLNPRLSVGQIIAEPLKNYGDLSNGQLKERVAYLMEKVGLMPEQSNRYPHQYSGGQRQRIGIARALALHPKIIVCDEPVSALDVSIQAQVINLLMALQEELGLAYIFIAHDLSVVEHISSRVAVMYLGKIVELASDYDMYHNPCHPYTQALLSAVPVPDPEAHKERILLKGDVPSPLDPPSGCAFHTRCPKKKDVCTQKQPVFKALGNEHYAACHFC